MNVPKGLKQHDGNKVCKLNKAIGFRFLKVL